ncbi:hypothetical protein CANCADRAFT_307 [Tortispora caseinolytica NRRL Y-17796]|uniref:Uncharacterized protein n=1 Tax=Tortispora caseinolytica NRRL Y-17796 TaxID=767744 RepID=A0A1E4TJ16_9ASCO|nr:hypothetical protein CANCADRAFT_307 [Tortispora caseinolytica NRRL Y-17796]
MSSCPRTNGLAQVIVVTGDAPSIEAIVNAIGDPCRLKNKYFDIEVTLVYDIWDTDAAAAAWYDMLMQSGGLEQIVPNVAAFLHVYSGAKSRARVYTEVSARCQALNDNMLFLAMDVTDIRKTSTTETDDEELSSYGLYSINSLTELTDVLQTFPWEGVRRQEHDDIDIVALSEEMHAIRNDQTMSLEAKKLRADEIIRRLEHS